MDVLNLYRMASAEASVILPEHGGKRRMKISENRARVHVLKKCKNGINDTFEFKMMVEQ